MHFLRRSVLATAAAGSEEGATEFVELISMMKCAGSRSLGLQDRGKITTERGSSVLNFIRKERGSTVALEEIAEIADSDAEIGFI